MLFSKRWIIKSLLLLSVIRCQSLLNVSVELVLSGCDDSRDVGVGDLDGDGFSDMVCPCKQQNDVIVALSGRRAFSGKHNTISLSQIGRRVQGPRSVSVADVDGDGLDDIAVGYSAPGISLFVNKGSGNFEIVALHTPGMINAVRLVDVDGDGRRDIFWIAQERNEIGWFRNVLGTIPAADTITNGHSWQPAHLELLGSLLSRNGFKSPKKLHSALVADLDRDDQLDIVLLDNYAPPTVISPLINLQRDSHHVNITTLDERWHVGARDACVADLDNDDILDVVVAYKTSDEISWYSLATGQRTVICSPGQCEFACALVCADITGDGVIDVVVAEKKSSRVDLFSNLNNGIEWKRTTLIHDLVHVGGIQPMTFRHQTFRSEFDIPDALAFVLRGGPRPSTSATTEQVGSQQRHYVKHKQKKRKRRRRLSISEHRGGRYNMLNLGSNHSRAVPGAFGVIILHRENQQTPSTLNFRKAFVTASKESKNADETLLPFRSFHNDQPP